MKVKDLLESKSQSQRFKEMSKDKVIKTILAQFKKEMNEYSSSFDKTKALLYAARKAGLNYPELDAIEKSAWSCKKSSPTRI